MLFDWAAQPWHTLVVTFIFAPYFVSAIAPDPVLGQALWAWTGAAAGLAIAISAPLLGAAADASGPRKPWIAGFGALYVLGAAALWWASPEPSSVWIALAAFAVGLIGAEYAAVFVNAMMPSLAGREEMGRLSGNGWALGYVGGVVALAIMLLALVDNEEGVTLLGAAPAFGLDAQAREGTRSVGPLTAIWFVVFALPLFLFVPDAQRKGPMRGALQRGLDDLKAALAQLPGRRSLSWFLGASMIYRDALNGFYAFGGIYAAGVLGWSIVQIGVFGILAAILGAVGCWVGGMADDRVGPKRVVAACLWGLTAASLLGISAGRDSILFVLPVGADSAAPDIVFYIAGGLVGAFGGAMQAASRTLLVRQADEAEMTSAFGLYALAGKATAFLAPLLVGWATWATGSQQAGVAPVIALFLLGLAALAPVDPEGDAQMRERPA